MKSIIIFLVVLIQVNVVSQDKQYGDATRLQGAIQLSDDIQFQMLVKKIMNVYGKSFTYFEQLQKGLFKFETIDKKGYFLSILNKDKQKIASIRLLKTKVLNRYVLDYDRTDLKKYLLAFVPDRGAVMYNVDIIETIVQRDNILNDEIIIEVPKYRDFKVFHRSFATQHLVDQEGGACALYELLADAVILPYYDSSASQYVPKVVSVDSWKHNILYSDQNYDIYSGNYASKYYCSQGNGDNELSNPTGITFGKEYISGGNTVYPIYVADHHNGRIVKSNFIIDNGGEAYFDANSFEVVSEDVNLPYEVELYESSTGELNKMWVSESLGKSTLVCLNSDGTVYSKIKGFRYTYDYTQWYTVAFEPGAKMRLAIYRPMNCLAFLYSIPGTDINEICTFLLDSTGVPVSMQNDTIVNVRREHFNTDYPLTSVNFQNIHSYSSQYPYMWITTGKYNHSGLPPIN